MHTQANGFTLVEIIIIMAITVIFLGVGTNGYVNSARRKGLEKDAELMVSALQVAKAYTLSRNIAGDTALPPCQLAGYTVGIPVGGSTYTLTRRCTNTTPLTKLIETKRLESTVIFSVSPAPANVIFTVPYGAVAATKTVVIRSAQLRQCIQIIISPYSAIRANEPYSC